MSLSRLRKATQASLPVWPSVASRDRCYILPSAGSYSVEHYLRHWSPHQTLVLPQLLRTRTLRSLYRKAAMQQQPPPHSAMQQLQVSVQTSDFQHQAPLPPNFSPYPPLTSDSSNAPPATPYGNLDPTLGQNGVQHNGGQAPASAPSSSKKEGNTGEAKARLRKVCALLASFLNTPRSLN